MGSDAIVLDLGANRGRFAQALKHRLGVKSHLVEANPVLAATLSNDTEFNVTNCAVASISGEVQFNIACNDEGSSILNLPTTSVYNCVLDHTVTVQAKTLDTICQDLGMQRIDLVKMDIEGAEIEVLKSISSDLLKRIAQFSIEFHCDSSFGFGMKEQVHQIISRLRKHNFICLKFSPTLVDVLFINRKMLGIPRLKGLLWEVRESSPSWIKAAWTYTPNWLKNTTRYLVGTGKDDLP